MKIIISYDSCWQNSFLTGSDDKPISKNNERKFKSSSKSKEGIDKREIGISTTLGILCRLIGDQRKLWDARQSDDYYFRDIESVIKITSHNYLNYTETAFITNKSEDRPAQGSFIGVLQDDTPIFFGMYSKNLWSVLYLSLEEILEFILSPKGFAEPLGKASPNREIRSSIDEISRWEPLILLETELKYLELKINKEKTQHEEKIKSGKILSEKDKNKLNRLIDEYHEILNSEHKKVFNEKLLNVLGILKKLFPDVEYLKNDKIYPMSLYAAALYLMRDELDKLKIDVSCFRTKKGGIPGFSQSGFNGIRDFLNPLTGGQKKCGGTPTELTKASGTLEIGIDIPKEKAKQLEEMIEAAGVSSFYLGKKGLAYVEEIIN